MLTTQTVEYTL